MKNKLALAACALLSIGSVMAADQPANNPPNAAPQQPSAPADLGFAGGLNLGQGGGGSANSLSGSFGSPVSGSAPASQGFGLSNPAAGCGVRGCAGATGLFR